MSVEKQFEIYTYTLSVLSLQLKVKFPCKIYLEHSGATITTEVPSSSPNKFVFNQEITIKNDTDKEYIEVIVNLITEKGAKYVGGVLKFVEKELIGSEGERIVVAINKCLDTEAFCQIRVDQVSTSRVARKVSAKKRTNLKSEYQPEINIVGWNNQRNKISHQIQTKSDYNFPLTVNRSKAEQPRKEPTIGPSAMKKNFSRANNELLAEKEPMGSMVGVSGVQFEVYKQGYNKLKEKYRKQAETARSELNRRMVLESNQNNLKLQLMRYKLKNQQLQKSVADKNIKIKELTQAISNIQKKELDIKYLKEEVQNKVYTIKNLEETIKTLTRDNSELKNIQNIRASTEQQTIRNLKDQLEKLKREVDNKQTQLAREIRLKNDVVTKKEYELHTKSEQLQRAKCSIEDLEKLIANKTFQWEKLQQSERTSAKSKQQQFKEKNAKIQAEKAGVEQKLKNTQQLLQQKRGEVVKMQYDKKVALQNNQSLQKENEQLRVIREKYVELVREHKLLGEERNSNEKNKDRQIRLKDTQIEDLTHKYNTLNQNTRKYVKQLQEKLKINQTKLVQSQSHNQLFKNQLEKSKRQNDLLNKEIIELKNQAKELRLSIKQKQERYLNLTNQLSDSKNRSKQGDYSIRLEAQRLKQQNEKYIKNLQEQRIKSKQYYDTINKLELQANKSKMQWQFREQRALKQLSYAKEKITSLETFKQDLQSQITSVNQTVTNLKASQKSLNEKIQKMQLQSIKSRQTFEKAKKQQKILQQKMQNSENTIKAKNKQINQHLQSKQQLQKKIAELENDMSQLKNDFNKQTNQKARNQKIVQILQGDLAKGKQEQVRLNLVISSREKQEEQLREEMKRQKEQSTKLQMRLSALKKETDKFKDTLVDNLQTIFTSIPDGTNLTNSPIRQSKVSQTGPKQNSQVLNLLTTLGKDARSNMAKLVDQLKIAQRDHQKLNSQFSTTVDKRNTTEFEYNQAISRLQEELSQALTQKQNLQNRYEEEVFLLEGRVKEKQEVINELTQQIQELDFAYKNTRTELDSYREEIARKDAGRNKLISQLRQQIEYHSTTIALLQNNLENHQEQLQLTQIQLEEKNSKVSKLEKDLFQSRQANQTNLYEKSDLKRDVKKLNEKCEELSNQLLSQKQQSQKLRHSLQEEERKSGELRQFLNSLMKQKEEIIKKQLQKSEQILELQTKIEQLKHENDWNSQEIKKYKKLEQEYKETIKKSTKALKDEENIKSQEKNKNSKLSDKLKEKERQLSSKDQTITKLQQKLKKQKEKLNKDIKELQNQIDQTYQKLLNKEKQSNQKILILQNQNERQKTELQKWKQQSQNIQQSLYSFKSKLQQKHSQLVDTEKQLHQSNQNQRSLQQKIKQFEQEFNQRQEQNFRLQNKIIALQGKLDIKENDKIDKLQNLHSEWHNKYEATCEQYQQRLDLAQKEKQFLRERIEEKDKQIKKLVGQVKLQENNTSVLKRSFEDKIKALEEDRLIVLSQKNVQNQRLVEENRVNFDNLKLKESEARHLSAEIQQSKATLSKLQSKLKDSEQKIKNLNRTYLAEIDELKKKEQSFKRLKENVVSSIWKSEREVKRVSQDGFKKILQVIDQKSISSVIEITQPLLQSIISAISIKVDEKQS